MSGAGGEAEPVSSAAGQSMTSGSGGMVVPPAGGEGGAAGVEVLGPGCGDGVLANGEACDDGNTASGDGCSQTCHVDPTWACTGEPSICAHSCSNLPATCGATGDQNCCAASWVDGGTFLRNTDEGLPATVGSFALDTFEITVGRFRAFVEAYPANRPSTGAGRNAKNPKDKGWDKAWNASLPEDQASLIASLKTCLNNGNPTWTDTPIGHEGLPITCLTWFEAQAFCIWDGGRLPTEAEWNYAATGGDEQRYYPWSVPAWNQLINDTFVYYRKPAIPPQLLAVGSKWPKGRGKWGQADLSGSVWEWVQDYYLAAGQPTDCLNCATLEPDQNPRRVYRGGSLQNTELTMASSDPTNRSGFEPSTAYDVLGARCARNVAQP